MRSARDFRYRVPSRAEVARRLEELVRGAIARSEVADWASEFITYDDPRIYPEIRDSAVWRALTQLAGADLPTTDRKFLHDENDFSAWLSELRGAE
jgi:hypothetical protein